MAGGQGLRMLRPIGTTIVTRVSDQPEQVPSGRVAAALPEVFRDTRHAGAGQIEGGPDVRPLPAPTGQPHQLVAGRG